VAAEGGLCEFGAVDALSMSTAPMSVMRVLGFMTGTSLDAVDMAILETDGEAISGFGPAGEKKLDPAVRALIEEAIVAGRSWPVGMPAPAAFATAAAAIAEEHLATARAFLHDAGVEADTLDLVGAHGRTVVHQPPGPVRPVGRTVQLIDARRLADGLGIPVAFDFRTADVTAGGQGAPLVPIYHAALARWSGLPLPAAVLNLGGVGNVTFIDGEGTLTAFDTGPANGMIDLFVQARTGARRDEGGALAGAGRVDEAVLAAWLAHPYFAATGPKSLDRLRFLARAGGRPVTGRRRRDAHRLRRRGRRPGPADPAATAGGADRLRRRPSQPRPHGRDRRTPRGPRAPRRSGRLAR